MIGRDDLGQDGDGLEGGISPPFFAVGTARGNSGLRWTVLREQEKPGLGRGGRGVRRPPG